VSTESAVATPVDEVYRDGVAVGDAGPLRILMVTPRVFPEIGGIETHVFEVGRRLAARGHSVVVLTTDRSRRLPVEEQRSGIAIRRVPTWPKRRDYYVAPRLFKEIMLMDCDVIHIQGCHTFVAPFAMLAAIRKNVPFVISFHSGGHSSRLRNALRVIQWAAIGPLVRARASRDRRIDLRGRYLPPSDAVARQFETCLERSSLSHCPKPVVVSPGVV
jgi:glycosyltransferase involved in cell wall biosynthesis